MQEPRFAFAGGYKFPMFEKGGLLIADLSVGRVGESHGKYGWSRVVTDANATETLPDGRVIDVAYRNLLERVRLALSLRWNLGGEENAGTEVLFENVR
jgi:hypothetical protein